MIKRLSVIVVLLLVFAPLAHSDISGPSEGTGSITCGSHTFTMSVRVEGLPGGCVLIEVEKDCSDKDLNPSIYSFGLDISEFVPEGSGASGVSPSVALCHSWTTEPAGTNHRIYRERYIWSTQKHHNGFWRITLTGNAMWGSLISDVLTVRTGFVMVDNLHIAPTPTAPAILRPAGSLPTPTIPVSFSESGWMAQGDVTVEIYPVEDPSDPVRTIDDLGNFSSPGTVTWDGKKDNGQAADPGLYGYRLRVEHAEQTWECTAGYPMRNQTGGEADKDDDTSSLTFSSVTVQPGTPQGGYLPFTVGYTLSAGADCQSCSLCGLRVYHGQSLIPIYQNDSLGTTLGTHSTDVQVPDCGEGDYYFVMWGRDGNCSGKQPYAWYGCGKYSHYTPLTRRIAERGVKYEATSTRSPLVSLEQAEEQPDPTPNNVMYFTATFDAAVMDFSDEYVVLDGEPANTQIDVSPADAEGRVYDVIVTVPAGTGATITASISAGAAAAGNSAASTSSDNTISYDPQNVIRVNRQGGNDLDDGSSWNRAKATIEAALSDAANNTSRKEIWVAAGVYVTPDWGGYCVPENVKLYGGFAGTEALRDDRDWHAHETILVGPGGGGSVVWAAADGCIVDGFTFSYQDEGVYTGGTATIANNVFDSTIIYGIRCEGSSPKIMGNLFSVNWTGILLESSSAVICNNVIKLCGEAGILSRGEDTSAITNNTVVGCENGIIVDGCGYAGHPTITNTIVAYSTSHGLLELNGASAVKSNNFICEPDPVYNHCDPGFVNGTGGDYHLASGSPCIDQGTNPDNEFLSQYPTDLSGSPRVIGSIVDIGAYEFNPEAFFFDVTLEKAASQSDPTDDPEIHFTATFERRVTDFDAEDVSIVTMTGGRTVAVTPEGSSGRVYDIKVTGMPGWGPVTAKIPAGAAHSEDNHANSESQTITIDYCEPVTVTSVSSFRGQSWGCGDVIPITVRFSAPVYVDWMDDSTYPKLILNIGSNTREAVFWYGSGGCDLHFGYEVQDGDVGDNVNYTGTNALVVGSIRDEYFCHIIAALPAPGVPGSVRCGAPTKPVVADDGISTCDLTQLHATWSAQGSAHPITHYAWAVGTAADMQNPQYPQNLTFTDVGTNTECTVPITLIVDETYYVVVKACNDQGVWGPLGVSDGITASCPTAVTVCEALGHAVGDVIKITNRVVTAGADQFSNRFYMQDEGTGACGIRVDYTGTLVLRSGDRVDVIGQVDVDPSNAEARLMNVQVQIRATGAVPDPVDLNDTDVGGNDYTATGNTKPGVNYPASSAAYNKGLLVRSTGTVTGVDLANKCFYVDDGSHISDGNPSGYTGIKVSSDWQSSGYPLVAPPAVGWTVSVTGISSSEQPQSGRVTRVLRPRKQDDVVVQNTNPPPAAYDDFVTSLPDGARITLKGWRCLGSKYSNAFYIEATDQSSGIIVAVPDELEIDCQSLVGKLVDISGVIWTFLGSDFTYGEREIWADAVTSVGTTVAMPRVVNMANKDVGGGPSGYYTGYYGCKGLHNIGLWARVYGLTEMYYPYNGWYWINDGSNALSAPWADWPGLFIWGIRSEWAGVYNEATGVIGAAPWQWYSGYGLTSVIPCVVTNEPLLEVSTGPALRKAVSLVPGLNSLSFSPPADYATPLSVFGELPIEHQLYRQDRAENKLLQFSRDTGFGNILMTDAQWFNNTTSAASVVYDSRPVPDDGDWWVTLPKAGISAFGNPANGDIPWSQVRVTDGSASVPISEAVGRNWIEGMALLYSSGLYESVDVQSVGSQVTQGRCYTIYTKKDNLALLVPAVPYADNILVSGTVTSSTTSLPIQGARVYADTGSTTTAADGTYQLHVRRTGNMAVSANTAGYQQQTLEIATDPGGVAANFQLAPTQVVCDLIADPPIVCGEYSSQIKAVLHYDSGIPVGSTTIDFATDLGHFANGTKTQSVTTSNSGLATVELLPGADTGPATVTATVTSPVVSASTAVYLGCPPPSRVDVVAYPERISPDGISQTTVYVSVLDAQGCYYVNAPVTWNVDLGTIISSDSVTDQWGEARLVLQSAVSPGTATVSANVEGVMGTGYVEFASSTAPSVRIVSPSSGDQVTSSAAVEVICSEYAPDGDSHITSKMLMIDGVPCGFFFDPIAGEGDGGTSTTMYPGLDTTLLSNGLHVLSAKVLNDDGSTALSNLVSISVDNPVSEVQVSSSEIFIDDPVPDACAISANVSTTGNWVLSIRDCSDDSVICSASGQQPGLASIMWDGKRNGTFAPGIYCAVIQFPGQQVVDLILAYIAVSHRQGRALIAGELPSDDLWLKAVTIQEMNAVYASCWLRGVPCTVIVNPIWKSGVHNGRFRNGMEWWLTQPYQYFYLQAHGERNRHAGHYMTHVYFCDGVRVTGNDYFMQPEARDAYSAFSDLNVPANKFQIVQMNVCYSYGLLLDEDRSIAEAFNLADVNNLDGGVYIGWRGPYWPCGVPVIDYIIPNGSGWTTGLWQRLGLCTTVGQAITQLQLFPYPWEAGWQKSLLSPIGLSAWVTWLL